MPSSVNQAGSRPSRAGGGQGRHRFGFTLVELLFVIAISGILATIIFSNFSLEKDRSSLKTASRQLQSDLQAMQSKGQSGVLYNGNPTSGYGLYLDQTNPNNKSYILFADTTGATHVYNSGQDAIMLTRNLPTNITISSINPGNPANIVFSAPNGTAYLNASTSSPVINIKLMSSKLNLCYTVTVAPYVGTFTETRNTTCP